MAQQAPNPVLHGRHGDPIYPSLFHVDDLLFPGLDIPYRWWEDEAITIFWANSAQDMRRLLLFRLYSDGNLPRSTLLGRSAGTVKGFLRCLLPPNERAYGDQLSHPETVEQFILLCQRRGPTEPLQGRWSWSLSNIQGDEAQTVAAKIDEESCQLFRNVPFEDWVHFSLAYPTESVERFVIQHKELYRLILMRLQSFPQHTARFVEIERCLRSRSPFAHLTVLECLRNRNIVVQDVDSSGQWLAEFLVKPIRGLFKSQISSLSLQLRKLSVLAIRFEKTYHQGTNIAWNAPLETKSRYLDELCADKSTFVLARTLTLSDERDFSSLSMQSFMMNDVTLPSLIDNWGRLCTCAEECYISNPDMADYLQDCVKNLYNLKNYHSASAIIHGLQTANPAMVNAPQRQHQQGMQAEMSAESAPPYFVLLDSNDTYGGYRRVFRENRGLPFLLPHITEYRQKGHDVLAAMFPLPLQ